MWLVFAGSAANADAVTGSQTFQFDIPSQSADSALTEFAEQADLTLVFPDEIVRDRIANALVGEYSLEDGIAILLEDTGLNPSFSNPIVLSITIDDTSRSGEESMRATRKAGLLAIIAGAFSGGVDAQEPTVTETEIQTSVVTGTVTDARTGANLKGAKVTIEETGLWVSTNDLGVFRFASVPAGSVTLTVSNLGYAGQSVVVDIRGKSVSQNFALRGGTELEEIVVIGQRSARLLALNQARTATNSKTVISADLLGTFNGTTVSDALRRAPGIAFVPDPLTGDGAQLIARGLEPDLNQVTINGQPLIDGTGLGRSPDLSNILTESIQSVTINTTLLPSQNSNGAGALIEIETKSPLDRDPRFASFTAEFGDTGDFGEEFEFGGTLSGILGNRQDFGVSLSGSYREREITRVGYALSSFLEPGEYLPLDADGNPVQNFAAIDPNTAFPFVSGVSNLYTSSVGASQSETENKLFSITGTVQKQFGDHTDLRFDMTFNRREDRDFSLTTDVRSSDRYDLAPVAELGGEERFSLVAEDIRRSQGENSFGTGFPGGITRRASYNPEQVSDSLVYNFEGDTSVGVWDLEYGAGFVDSKNKAGERFSFSFDEQGVGLTGSRSAIITRDLLTEEALQNTTADGRVVSVFAPLVSGDQSFVLPLFTPQGFDFYNTLENFNLSTIVNPQPRESFGETLNLNGSVRRSFDGRHLRYLELGANYQDTEFVSPAALDRSGRGQGAYLLASDVTATDLGLRLSPGILTSVGATRDFAAIDPQSVIAVANNLDGLNEAGAFFLAFDPRESDFQRAETSEETYTAYLESRVDLGKFEVIGGARFEEIRVSSTSFLSPSVTFEERTPETEEISAQVRDLGALATDSATQTEILPRVLVNYRPSENLVFRAGYFVTVSRPQLSNLTDARSVALDLRPRYGDSGDQPRLLVSQGNPDLKPARTHSFNIDAEWYRDEGALLRVSLFYKEIEDSLQQTREEGGLSALPNDLVLPDFFLFQEDLPEDIFVSVTQPVNSPEDDTIWGVELTAEQPLWMLPSPFDGLSLYTNYTYTDSESTRFRNVSTDVDPSGVVPIPNIPFNGSPEHQGTFGFIYSKAAFDSSLLYTGQSRRLSGFRPFGLSLYDEAFDTLDLEFAYTFQRQGTNIRLFVRGEDLLRGEDDPFLQTSIGGEDGVGTYYTGGTYLGGPSVFMGISGSL